MEIKLKNKQRDWSGADLNTVFGYSFSPGWMGRGRKGAEMGCEGLRLWFPPEQPCWHSRKITGTVMLSMGWRFSGTLVWVAGCRVRAVTPSPALQPLGATAPASLRASHPQPPCGPRFTLSSGYEPS